MSKTADAQTACGVSQETMAVLTEAMQNAYRKADQAVWTANDLLVHRLNRMRERGSRRLPVAVADRARIAAAMDELGIEKP